MNGIEPAATIPLFVFGTLRRDHRNHHYLHGHYDQVVPAILRGYQRLHELMIVLHPDGIVDGELYFLKSEDFDATLAGCDELEEIPPGQLVGRDYQRKQVSVDTSTGVLQAWAYVQPETGGV